MSGERVLNERDVVEGWVERIRSQVAAVPRLRRRAPRPGGQQPRLDRAAVGHRLPARRRQALPGQPDAGQGVGVRRGCRVEAGISFTEFSYQLLQGMDFLELYRRYGCTLQTGGSDQWGNLTAGIDLDPPHRGRRRCTRSPPRWSPRPTARSSARPRAAPIWLDPEMTSPYAFYQFWLNAEDAKVVDLPQGLHLPRPRGDRGARARRPRRPQPREAQRALAEDVTTLVHGADRRWRRPRGESGPVRAGRSRRARRRDPP